jgi:hypothetical protein
MIANTDEIGNYFVTVVAVKHRIATFQCPSLADCEEEVARIVASRSLQGKTTSRATAKRMKGKSGRIRLYDEPITLYSATDKEANKR